MHVRKGDDGVVTAERPDELLRRAFEALSESEGFRADCPPADRLWDGARGALTPEETRVLTEHLAGCGACAAAWRAALAFGSSGPTRADDERPRHISRFLALAAGVLITAAGVLIYQLLRDRPPEPVETLSRATDIALPPQLSPLEPAPIRVPAEYALVWRGAGDGAAFLKELADALAPYRAGDYVTAVARLEPLAQKYGDVPEPWFYLGVSQLMIERPREALASLARARPHAHGDLLTDVDRYAAIAKEQTR